MGRHRISNDWFIQETSTRDTSASWTGIEEDYQHVPYVTSGTPGPYKCMQCGRVYRWKKTLVSHLRHECGMKPQFKCPYCPMQTKQNNSWSSIHPTGDFSSVEVESIIPMDTNILPGHAQTMKSVQDVFEPLPVFAHSQLNPSNLSSSVFAEPCSSVNASKSLQNFPKDVPSISDSERYEQLFATKNRETTSTMHPRGRGPRNIHKNLSSRGLGSRSMSLVGSEASLSQNLLMGISHTKGRGHQFPASEGPGVFICKSCGKVYRWKRTLQYHVRFECGKEPKFQCPYCPLKSKRKGNIAAHIKYLHQKPK
ncbi:hypothetical protein C0J52_13316 [Blattella germanica]|nr:hypothetical protein C0J52_13316 [Blattella germanica]